MFILKKIKMKIDHIGIAVKDIEVSSALFSTILNRKPFSFERVESQKLSAVFLKWKILPSNF